MHRRDFMRLSMCGTLALMTNGCTVAPIQLPTSVNLLSEAEIALTAIQDEISVLPGKSTPMWRYQGELLSGNSDVLQFPQETFLGPTIRVRRGQTLRVHFKNELPVPSGIHWHGMLVPERMDGHPRDIVQPGESYTYEFTVQNRAGTYWYHPHPNRRTGYEVYQGLTGMLLVSDEEETASDLPSDEYDIALMIQDRLFDGDNQLVYTGTTGEAGSGNGHTQSMGMTGNRILVNGRPDFTLPVERRAYRLRLVNGSNSRIYVLGWADQTPLQVIGTDGGLLTEPLERPYVTLGPAERIELWVDFNHWEMDEKPDMLSYNLGSGQGFPIFKTHIAKESQDQLSLPKQLTTITPLRVEDAVNADKPRDYYLTSAGGAWTINGRPFELEAVTINEKVQFGTTEIWEFVNDGSRGGGVMPHPMHIHGVQFQVLERIVDPAQSGNRESLLSGYVDVGWKDTVFVMPGERVRVIMRFDAHPGLFLVHCHNLEHEDMSMMRNFLIEG